MAGNTGTPPSSTSGSRLPAAAIPPMEYCCQPVRRKRQAQTSVVYGSPLAENAMYPLQVQKE